MPHLPRPKRYRYQRPKQSGTASGRAVHKTNRWKTVSANYRARYPFCEYSLKVLGEDVPADHTDHIVSIAMGGDHFADANLMSLTKEVHGRKSAREAIGYRPECRVLESGKCAPYDRDQVLQDLRPPPLAFDPTGGRGRA
ncbi:5-methylcytosine-specific restriction endonuclease McrA [Lewinella antarctica]|uniref:5-methylcytosine-specific restriction endonuclease McrA n=1 Tax=Neolewinella antarctica TaxID=442734 RepID=A0ABX0X6G0_9BACT|nr:5-methylcytosine-specific restriction endonuclease McrA [Neolewinella antarctica]